MYQIIERAYSLAAADVDSQPERSSLIQIGLEETCGRKVSCFSRLTDPDLNSSEFLAEIRPPPTGNK
uniref:Uncharacterized protein n=1 Tax=Romanomermis culicivorax TaxID=13658 RepID=A0A915IUN6_ROMCU